MKVKFNFMDYVTAVGIVVLLMLCLLTKQMYI